MRYDENGWAVDQVAAGAVADHWSLFAKDDQSRMNVAQWSSQASRFFVDQGATIALETDKTYPAGGMPRADHAIVRVGEQRVVLITLPLDAAPSLRVAADQGVAAIGGAGFDALLRRAVRVWQIEAVTADGDRRAPLLLTAIVASVLLSPVLPPGGGTIFGVKGCRQRLDALAP